tara:strand:- start:75 stop:317 length:243 start_codon:yes stop_codon:yes gene_type:complete
MPRRARRKGRLIQKPKAAKSANTGRYKIIAENTNPYNLWTFGEYDSLQQARTVLDNMDTSNVSYYIYSDLNRVLYTKKGA